MTAESDPPWAQEFLRLLGDELRRSRKELVGPRTIFQERIVEAGVHISLQTVATYEMGTRSCSVVRFITLCQALGLSRTETFDLLNRALDRLDTENVNEITHITIDLAVVAESEQPDLRPLRLWARHMLNESPRSTRIRLNLPALQNLADLVGTSRRDLIRDLRGLQER